MSRRHLHEQGIHNSMQTTASIICYYSPPLLKLAPHPTTLSILIHQPRPQSCKKNVSIVNSAMFRMAQLQIIISYSYSLRMTGLDINQQGTRLSDHGQQIRGQPLEIHVQTTERTLCVGYESPVFKQEYASCMPVTAQQPKPDVTYTTLIHDI